MKENEKNCWNRESSDYCVSEYKGVLKKHFFDGRPDEIIQLILN